ncbi:unnamed protein product [Prorocentrum cordatum]|uniref:Uncharacterized protein n=1 Tax=Prorocentrum cordatum TaxID=2364126 RepID=A0ABN9UQ75_9DINO|nr:unnamed protein product [Polarella glacialis]
MEETDSAALGSGTLAGSADSFMGASGGGGAAAARGRRRARGLGRPGGPRRSTDFCVDADGTAEQPQAAEGGGATLGAAAAEAGAGEAGHEAASSIGSSGAVAPQDGSLADASGASNGGPAPSGSDAGAADEGDEAAVAADGDVESASDHCIPRTELLTIRAVMPLDPPPERAALRTERVPASGAEVEAVAQAGGDRPIGTLAHPEPVGAVVSMATSPRGRRAEAALVAAFEAELLPPPPGLEAAAQEAAEGAPPVPGTVAPARGGGAEGAAAAPSAAPRRAAPPEPAALQGGQREDAAAMCEPGADARRADTDPVTREMVQQLHALFQKRARAASEALAREFAEKWGEALPTREGRGGLEEPRREACALEELLAEASGLVAQVARSDAGAAAALLEASRQGAGGPQIQRAVSKELAHWREVALPKAVLKAVEGKAFADQLAEGLRAPSQETAPLMEVLQPKQQQLLEALQDMIAGDLRQWCADVANRKGIVSDRELAQARGALDLAMSEVRAQSRQALERSMDQIRGLSSAPKLSRTCSGEVAATVRGEVKRWQEAMPRRGPQSAHGHLYEGMCSRLRAAAAPLQADLRAMAQDVRDANRTLTSSGPAPAGAGRHAALASERARALAAAAAGQLAEAFEGALAWDCDPARPASAGDAALLELVCDQLRQAAPAASTEPQAPEDLLARPAAAGLGATARLRAAALLLQRAVLDTADFSRVEGNLEWALALLQSAAEGDDPAGLGSGLELAGPLAGRALEELRAGERPRALAEAPAPERRRVVQTARMALKSLELLARLGRGG